MAEKQQPEGSSRKRRLLIGTALAVYLGWMVWTFFFSPNILAAQAVFIIVSILLWFVLRAIRPRTR